MSQWLICIELDDEDRALLKGDGKERIEGVRPRIPLGDKFWPLTKPEYSGLKRLLDDPKQPDFLRLLTRNKENDKVSLVDAGVLGEGMQFAGKGTVRCTRPSREWIPLDRYQRSSQND
jgi:hypothetical protein